MSGLFMDFPDWTPEQRVAIARVAILRLQNAAKPTFHAGHDTGSPPAAHPLGRVVTSTFFSTEYHS